MGSDEIMPEVLRQQNPGSLGWMEGGLSCWEGSGEITPPSSVTLAPGLQGEFQRAGGVGMRCVQHVAHGQGSAGICVRGLGSFWGVHGGVGTQPVLRAADGFGCPWERC